MEQQWYNPDENWTTTNVAEAGPSVLPQNPWNPMAPQPGPWPAPSDPRPWWTRHLDPVPILAGMPTPPLPPQSPGPGFPVDHPLPRQFPVPADPQGAGPGFHHGYEKDPMFFVPNPVQPSPAPPGPPSREAREAQGLLQQEDHRPAPPTSGTSLPDDLRGINILGDYRIVQQETRLCGGTADILCAVRERPGDQPARFALKVLRQPEKEMSESAQKVLEKEIVFNVRMAGREHICAMEEVIQFQERPVMVFPWALGGSLTRLLSLLAPPVTRSQVGERLEMGLQLLQGVRQVHEDGVVHLDLKPGNILLQPSAEDEQQHCPHVDDFGAALVRQVGPCLHARGRAGLRWTLLVGDLGLCVSENERETTPWSPTPSGTMASATPSPQRAKSAESEASSVGQTQQHQQQETSSEPLVEHSDMGGSAGGESPSTSHVQQRTGETGLSNGGATQSPLASAEGELLGITFSYAAPEIVWRFGRIRRDTMADLYASRSADTWSLGLLLAEMLVPGVKRWWGPRAALDSTANTIRDRDMTVANPLRVILMLKYFSNMHWCDGVADAPMASAGVAEGVHAADDDDDTDAFRNRAKSLQQEAQRKLQELFLHIDNTVQRDMRDAGIREQRTKRWLQRERDVILGQDPKADAVRARWRETIESSVEELRQVGGTDGNWAGILGQIAQCLSFDPTQRPDDRALGEALLTHHGALMRSIGQEARRQRRQRRGSLDGSLSAHEAHHAWLQERYDPERRLGDTPLEETRRQCRIGRASLTFMGAFRYGDAGSAAERLQSGYAAFERARKILREDRPQAARGQSTGEGTQLHWLEVEADIHVGFAELELFKGSIESATRSTVDAARVMQLLEPQNLLGRLRPVLQCRHATSAFFRALWERNPRLRQSLLRVLQQDGTTVFHHLAVNPNSDTLCAFLAPNVRPSALDRAWLVAEERRQNMRLRPLLCGVRRRTGLTPLSTAVRHGNRAMVAQLSRLLPPCAASLPRDLFLCHASTKEERHLDDSLVPWRRRRGRLACHRYTSSIPPPAVALWDAAQAGDPAIVRDLLAGPLGPNEPEGMWQGAGPTGPVPLSIQARRIQAAIAIRKRRRNRRRGRKRSNGDAASETGHTSDRSLSSLESDCSSDDENDEDDGKEKDAIARLVNECVRVSDWRGLAVGGALDSAAPPPLPNCGAVWARPLEAAPLGDISSSSSVLVELMLAPDLLIGVALHRAARFGSAEIVESLLSKGVLPTHHPSVYLALQTACYLGHASVVRSLARSVRDWSKLHWYGEAWIEWRRARKGISHLVVAATDADRDDDTSNGNGNSASFNIGEEQADSEAMTTARRMYLCPWVWDDIDSIGLARHLVLPPLQLAARQGHQRCVAELVDTAKIRFPMSPDRTLYRGEAAGPLPTALSLAVQGGHDGCVETLLHAGAQPNQPDAEGYYPLHLAARLRDSGPTMSQGSSVWTLLLEKGAELDPSQDLPSALAFAAAAGRTNRVSDALEQHVQVADKELVQEALWVAAIHGKIDCVRILVNWLTSHHVLGDNNRSASGVGPFRHFMLPVTESRSVHVMHVAMFHGHSSFADFDSLKAKLFPDVDSDALAEHLWFVLREMVTPLDLIETPFRVGALSQVRALRKSIETELDATTRGRDTTVVGSHPGNAANASAGAGGHASGISPGDHPPPPPPPAAGSLAPSISGSSGAAWPAARHTLLQLAIRQGHTSVASDLLDLATRLEALGERIRGGSLRQDLVRTSDPRCPAALHIAVSMHQTSLVKKLMDVAGPYWRERSSPGCVWPNATPLFIAAMHGHADIVGEMLNHLKGDLANGSLNDDKRIAFIRSGCTRATESALSVACALGSMLCVQRLLEDRRGAEVTPRLDSLTPFQVAVLHNQGHLFEHAALRGPTESGRMRVVWVRDTATGETRADLASRHLYAIQPPIQDAFLVDVGDSAPVLYVAALLGARESVLALLRAGCRSDERTDWNENVMHAAIRSGAPSLVQTLLDMIPSLFVPPSASFTGPVNDHLSLAVRAGQAPVVRALLDKLSHRVQLSEDQMGRVVSLCPRTGGDAEAIEGYLREFRLRQQGRNPHETPSATTLQGGPGGGAAAAGSSGAPSGQSGDASVESMSPEQRMEAMMGQLFELGLQRPQELLSMLKSDARLAAGIVQQPEFLEQLLRMCMDGMHRPADDWGAEATEVYDLARTGMAEATGQRHGWPTPTPPPHHPPQQQQQQQQSSVRSRMPRVPPADVDIFADDDANGGSGNDDEDSMYG